MSEFTVEELDRAFHEHLARVEDVRRRAAWDEFPLLFTDDVEYVEHAYGTFHGREAVRDWAMRTMGVYPGRIMTDFPIAWYVVDQPTARVICELRNLMPDPGDGSALEQSNITILTYAGEGRWSRAEDIYNPMKFARLARDWARRAEAFGNVPDDARQYLD